MPKTQKVAERRDLELLADAIGFLQLKEAKDSLHPDFLLDTGGEVLGIEHTLLHANREREFVRQFSQPVTRGSRPGSDRARVELPKWPVEYLIRKKLVHPWQRPEQPISQFVHGREAKRRKQ